MSATLVSSRREGKERQQKKVAFTEREKSNATNIKHLKIGPPAKQSKEVENEDRDLGLDKVRLATRVKKEFVQGKALPYVDVPPLRTDF